MGQWGEENRKALKIWHKGVSRENPENRENGCKQKCSEDHPALMVVELSLQLGVASYWLCPEVLHWEAGSANPAIYDFKSKFFLKSTGYLLCPKMWELVWSKKTFHSTFAAYLLRTYVSGIVLNTGWFIWHKPEHFLEGTSRLCTLIWNS